jgi:hypothetical protein
LSCDNTWFFFLPLHRDLHIFFYIQITWFFFSSCSCSGSSPLRYTSTEPRLPGRPTLSGKYCGNTCL